MCVCGNNLFVHSLVSLDFVSSSYTIYFDDMCSPMKRIVKCFRNIFYFHIYSDINNNNNKQWYVNTFSIHSVFLRSLIFFSSFRTQSIA